MDTVEETRRSPIAIPRGFLSGLASDMIARNDDALLEGSCVDKGRKRDDRGRLGGSGGTGVVVVVGGGVGVARNLAWRRMLGRGTFTLVVRGRGGGY